VRACAKCGCTEKRACLEFDAEGYAHPCHWYEDDLCSACVPDEQPSSGMRSGMVRVGKGGRGYLRAAWLAGMVARPRR
jgi:hypothetical protein